MCHVLEVPPYLLIIGGGIMWVYSYTRKYHPWVRFRQCQRGTARGKITARVDHTSNPAGNGSLNYGFTVGIKTGGVNVGVAIDKQNRLSF